MGTEPELKWWSGPLRRLWPHRWFIAVLILALSLSALTLLTAEVTYSVSGTSEYLEVELDQAVTWTVRGAVLGPNSQGPFPSDVDELVVRNASVRFERISDAASFIEIRPRIDGGEFVDVSLDGRPFRVERLVLTYDSIGAAGRSHNHVYDVSGRLTVGRVAGQSIPGYGRGLLREADVSLLAKPWLGSEPIVVEEAQLRPGDVFTIAETSGVGFGFIAADERPGWYFSFNGVGSRGRVDRIGTTGYDLEANNWDRVTGEPLVRAAWTLALVLFFMAELWTKVPRALAGPKPKKPSVEE